MKKTSVSVAVVAVLGLSASAAQATTLTFANGPGAGNTAPFVVGPGLTTPSAINASPFTTTPLFPPPNPRHSEYRMIDPGGVLGGGGQKSIFDGGETWTFCTDCGTLLGVSMPLNNPGAFAGANPTANTAQTLGVAAPFFGPGFNFLAPIEFGANANAAGAAYGGASISFTSGDNFTVFFPTMEAQWGGTYFPLAAITLDCVGALSGNFHCAGEHTITIGEDPGGAGFSGWTAQWNLFGTITPVHTPEVPVPAAVWLFGSGLMGLVGVARRRRKA